MLSLVCKKHKAVVLCRTTACCHAGRFVWQLISTVSTASAMRSRGHSPFSGPVQLVVSVQVVMVAISQESDDYVSGIQKWNKYAADWGEKHEPYSLNAPFCISYTDE